MNKPDYHFFVCASFRGTEAKGKCIKKDSLRLIPYLEEETGRPWAERNGIQHGLFETLRGRTGDDHLSPGTLVS